MIANRYSGRYGQRVALCVAFLVLGSQAGVAGDDHDRARQALEAGEVLPLRSILERVERDYPGQVLDVELERSHEKNQERWVYEVKVLRAGGVLVKLKVDARDGAIIGRKFKDAQDIKEGHEGEKAAQRIQHLRRRGEGT